MYIFTRYKILNISNVKCGGKFIVTLLFILKVFRVVLNLWRRFVTLQKPQGAEADLSLPGEINGNRLRILDHSG